MYIALDLETTGFSPEKDKIIEFGAVKFDDQGPIETLQFLVNPEIKVPPIITHITNIQDKELQNAEIIENKKNEIQKFLGSMPIIGHNIQFDLNFLTANGIIVQNPAFDTHLLSSVLLADIPSFSLEILSNIFDIKHQEKHRALDDSLAAMELFLELKKAFQSLPEKLLKKIKLLSQKSDWQLKTFWNELEAKKEENKINDYIQIEEIKSKAKTKQIADVISSNKTPTLFNISASYKSLAQNLVNTAKKNDLIALPHDLFKKVSKLIPDTIAKIDVEENYISIKRLKEFEQKNHFLPHEISGLLKIVIWLEKTQTGLLSEIAFIQDEKKIISKINANPKLAILEEEQFIQKAIKKEKELPTICTHDFIINKKPSNDTLTIIDIEKFSETLFRAESIFINFEKFINPLTEIQELNPDNENITNLINKATIIFGLIGIIHEKHNDKNQYADRCTVDYFIANSNEWENAIESINQIIKDSQKLIEITNQQTEEHLKIWKNNLQNISDIFKNADWEKNLTIIEKDHNQNPILKRTPYSIQNSMENILKTSKNHHIIGKNLNIHDQGKFSKKYNNFNDKIQFINFEKTRTDIALFILNDSTQDDISDAMIEFLKKETGKTAILLNSKTQLEHYTLKLSLTLPQTNILSQKTGSIGKISELYKQNPQNSIMLLTPHAWIKMDTSPLNIKNLIITKIPFAPMSDPYVIMQEKKFDNIFMDFSIPMATMNLIKIINKLKRNKIKKNTYIIDSKLTTKDYGKIITSKLTTITAPKIINTANLTSNVK